jgi:hypothetical protein
MYFVVNGITNYRQTNVEFTIDAKNNGGSFLGTPKLKNKSKNPVKPVKNVFHVSNCPDNIILHGLNSKLF